MSLRWILVILSVFLFLSGYFIAQLGNNPVYALISILLVIALALPSFLACYMWLGRTKSLTVLGVLCIYAITLESLSLLTGVPYGEFSYSIIIGWKIFGLTPWTVPFAYIPLILGATSFSSRIVNKDWRLVLVSTFLLVATDMVLDPVSVFLEIWHYKNGGIYYGVPWSNFFGWVISGAIGSTLFIGLTEKERQVQMKTYYPKELMSSTVFFLIFWFSVAFWRRMIIPTIIGVLLISSYMLLIRNNLEDNTTKDNS